MATFIPLPDRSLLALTGPDARTLLQGLVTVDVTKIPPGGMRWGALLSPQGKYLHDFFLLAEPDGIWLDVHSARLADLQSRLKLYRLRAQVEITPKEHLAVFALLEPPPQDAPPEVRAVADPRLEAMGWRVYGPRAACEEWLARSGFARADAAEYERHRLMLGVPDGASDLVVDRSLIMECGFEDLRGIDFNKGCYVGQEVTARTKFRATLRKQFYVVEADAPLPDAGTPVTEGDKQMGELRSHFEGRGLAMLSMEAAHSMQLKAGETGLRVREPAWRKTTLSAGSDESAG